MWYKLVGGKPVPCEVGEKHIRTWHLRHEYNGVLISTVFLGLDHGFGDGPPVLFETMVFGLIDEEIQMRYCTMDEAIAGHRRIALKYMPVEVFNALPLLMA